MKNKKVLLISVTVFVIVMFSFIYAKQLSSSDLISQNIEALALSESLGPRCSLTGQPGTYYIKNCSNCRGPYGHYALDSIAFC